MTGASLGSRQRLSALDALVQALPGGNFTFDTAARSAGETTISLSAEALQAHLDELAVQTANGASRLPSFDAVPAVIAQDNSSSGEEPLPLDRGTLQTLLAVDGHRTVREIVAHRGSLDALWQLGNLAEVGLIGLDAKGALGEVVATAAPPLSEPVVAEPAPVEPTPAQPFVLDVAEQQATVHCPKLGFEDDPESAFGRPTRLHRCFAAATPLPLSLDQQSELCLSHQFGTCPRLTMRTFAPPARDAQAAWARQTGADLVRVGPNRIQMIHELCICRSSPGPTRPTVARSPIARPSVAPSRPASGRPVGLVVRVDRARRRHCARGSIAQVHLTRLARPLGRRSLRRRIRAQLNRSRRAERSWMTRPSDVWAESRLA